MIGWCLQGVTAAGDVTCPSTSNDSRRLLSVAAADDDDDDDDACNPSQLALLSHGESRSCEGHNPDDIDITSGEGHDPTDLDLVTQHRPLQAANEDELWQPASTLPCS